MTSREIVQQKKNELYGKNLQYHRRGMISYDEMESACDAIEAESRVVLELQDKVTQAMEQANQALENFLSRTR